MNARQRPVVRVADLHYAYAGADGPVPVLHGIDFEAYSGEFISILGSSGGGKSTLMNLIGGLDRPTSGSLEVDGQSLSALAPREMERFRQARVSFVFQFFNLLSTLTAFENVMLGMEAMDEPPPDARDRALAVLEKVGLSDKLDRFPAQLSGGEQQRVAIARALAKRAPLILADEPTGNLDSRTAAAVMDLVVAVQRDSGSTLLLITHDRGVADRADRVVELVDGRLRERAVVLK